MRGPACRCARVWAQERPQCAAQAGRRIPTRGLARVGRPRIPAHCPVPRGPAWGDRAPAVCAAGADDPDAAESRGTGKGNRTAPDGDERARGRHVRRCRVRPEGRRCLGAGGRGLVAQEGRRKSEQQEEGEEEEGPQVGERAAQAPQQPPWRVGLARRRGPGAGSAGAPLAPVPLPAPHPLPTPRVNAGPARPHSTRGHVGPRQGLRGRGGANRGAGRPTPEPAATRGVPATARAVATRNGGCTALWPDTWARAIPGRDAGQDEYYDEESSGSDGKDVAGAEDEESEEEESDTVSARARAALRRPGSPGGPRRRG